MLKKTVIAVLTLVGVAFVAKLALPRFTSES